MLPCSGTEPESATSITLLEGLNEPDNQTAWRRFDRRHRPMVLNSLRGILGPYTAEVEEGAQDALWCAAQAYRAGRYDRRIGRLRAWVLGFAKKIGFGQRRAIAARREIQLPDESSGTGMMERFPDARLRESERLAEEREQQRAALRKCFEIVRSKHDVKTVAAFVFYVGQGRPAKKVAESLGMKVSQVYVAKHRILGAIREILGQMEGTL